MNKYEEAFERIFGPFDYIEPLLTEDDRFLNVITRIINKKDYLTLKELVEKAKPKRVLKRETNGQEIKIGNVTFKIPDMWYCPTCGNWISPSTSVNNCGHCGQRLDYRSDKK